MKGKAIIDLGQFRNRPPMMFEGEWRALKLLKNLRKQGIWKIFYKEWIKYGNYSPVTNKEIEREFDWYIAEKRMMTLHGTIEITWRQ